MPKNSQKFIFLAVVVIGALCLKFVFPPLSIGPQSATADQSIDGAGSQASGTPLLVLPEISAANGNNGIGTTQVSSSTGSVSSSTSFPTFNSSFSQVSDTTLPRFTSQSYMIADLTTGTTFVGSNADARWPTASLTKLMTATLVLDNISTSTEITITPEMFAADPTEQTLKMGDTYSVNDLLHLLLMPSSNVAAEALAQYYGRTQFMAMMNQRAQAWGMKNTYFDDPSGISAANESSANDLLILAQHIYNNYPEILAITRTPSWLMSDQTTSQSITIRSINVFAGESVFVGGKTGNTPQAGGNLLSIFSYKDQPIFIVVLGAPALPFQDTSSLFTWFRTNFT